MTLPDTIRHQPLFVVTLCYIVGITLSLYFTLPLHIYTALLLINGVFIAVILLGKLPGGFIALLFFFTMAGLLNGTTAQRLPDSADHIRNRFSEGQEYVVMAKVIRTHGFNGRVAKFDAKLSSMRNASSTFSPAYGQVRFSLQGTLPTYLVPGNTYGIRAKLKKPHRFGTPGSFDYPQYLARQDIHVTGYIKSPFYIQQVHVEEHLFQRVLSFPELLRTRINTFIDSNLSGDQAAIYKALLTGDRASISPQVIESFKSTGCLHILAISGIHMSLLGFVLYICFFWLLRRSTWLINRINVKKAAFLLCITPLFFYTLIAGAKTPVVRSLVMSLVVILAVCSGRKHSFGSLIALAALSLLLFSPMELTSPSFQLSFIAVISIVAILPFLNSLIYDRTAINAKRHRLLRWLIPAIAVSLAATLGTAPLLLYHFQLLSLVGVVANLLIEPLLCFWSLVIGFFATGFIFIQPAVATYLFKAGALGISLAIEITTFFNELNYSSINLPAPSLLQIAGYYICISILLLQHKFKTRLRMVAFVLLSLIATSVVLPPQEITRRYKKNTTISYLDVGHGSCSLLLSPGGRRILIDGGGLASPRFNIGKSVIAPFLLQQKITSLDDVVITHADSDHYNGIPFLFKTFGVKRLWVNTIEKNDKGWQKLLSDAASAGVEVVVPEKDTNILSAENTSLVVLANTTNPVNFQKNNDSTLVVKYRHGTFTALFPGDISMKLEKKLISENLELGADVLLAAHHGSNGSNSSEFLRVVDPTLMIVSSGRRRASKFSTSPVMARCENLGIPVILTTQSGTVTIHSENGEYQVSSFY